MRTYYQFESLKECTDVISAINSRKNYRGGTNTWCTPHKNQTEDKWIIPYDSQQIGDCLDLLNKFEELTKHEAEKRGWYFGVFSGSLAREREKLEDMHFTFDALVESYGRPNFPATRSLALSFLSSCYSLKESLSKKVKNTTLKSKLENWWKQKKAEQDSRNEMLSEFHIFMNTEKHGGAASGQVSKIKFEPQSFMTSLIIVNHHPHADPKTMRLSAEGAFMTAYANTPNERRFPVGIHEARYEIKVANAPKSHLGQNIENATFLEMMALIRNYYMQLLFEAEMELGERNLANTPSINFSGTQFMEVNK